MGFTKPTFFAGFDAIIVNQYFFIYNVLNYIPVVSIRVIHAISNTK